MSTAVFASMVIPCEEMKILVCQSHDVAIMLSITNSPIEVQLLRQDPTNALLASIFRNMDRRNTLLIDAHTHQPVVGLRHTHQSDFLHATT